MRIRRGVVVQVSLLILLSLVGLASPASAVVTYTVNSTADDGDGMCQALALGDCTLREAIAAANASAGLDKIQFDIGTGVPTIDVLTELPQVTDPVNLNGNTGGATRVELSGPAGADPGRGLTFEDGSDGSIVRKLVINDFGASNLRLLGPDAIRVYGNWIGLDKTGLTVIPGSANGIVINGGAGHQIGSPEAGKRNVVSGHVTTGIHIASATDGGHSIRGNYVGTNADGTGALGNGVGIELAASTPSNLIELNVIGDNGDGVVAGGSVPSAYIYSNRIGIDVNGDPIPNGNGVVVKEGATGVDIGLNSIDHNTGLGIDLGDDGVTPNDNSDADTGPNGHLNFPVLTRADALESTTRVNGRVRISAPNTGFVVDLFVSPACDPSGHGEGATFVHAGAANSDALGRATFSFEVNQTLPVGHVVTAVTRTLVEGSSEFSACEVVI